ncbi:MAG TPA: hypothetical protein VH257_07650, partial [Chloroflexota bacterium]|nr:hypothetical protein [Chloroflexota bacterium]
REAFRPVATGVHLIETARRLWPAEFGWRGGAAAGAGSRPARRGEFPEGGPQQAPPAGKVLPIDRLYGGPGLRQRIDAGEGAEAIIASWDVAPFEVLGQRARLYS